MRHLTHFTAVTIIVVSSIMQSSKAGARASCKTLRDAINEATKSLSVAKTKAGTSPEDLPIEILRSCPGLVTLRLYESSISDLAGLGTLSGLCNLRHVDLLRTDVEDISPLAAACSRLESLDISRAMVNDLSPLSTCVLSS